MTNRVHSGQLYTARQLFGGLLLAFTFFLLLIITMSMVMNSDEIKNYYFFAPILVALAYALLAYIFVFNETVNLRNKMSNKVNDFKLEECPDGFEKRIESKADLPVNSNTVVACSPKDSNPSFDKEFYLSGDNDICGIANREKNGCFNKVIGREEKCNAIKQYFSGNQKMIDGWNDYADNCI